MKVFLKTAGETIFSRMTSQVSRNRKKGAGNGRRMTVYQARFWWSML